MNRKFYGLFIKRLYKWLFLLCCLIGMLIPLIHVSKSYIRNIVEQNLTWDIQESIDMMEHDFNKAHQMIMNGRYGSFSPKMLQAFEEVASEFEEILKKYPDED